MQRGMAMLAGVVVLLSVVALDLAAGAACTLTVHPGMSIQETIDDAPEGAVVCLADGEWRTNLVIMRSLVLRGQGSDRSAVRGQEDDVPVIRVATDASGRDPHVRIEALAVVGGREQKGIWVPQDDGPLSSACGIFVERSAHAVIHGCWIVGHVDGIRLTGTSSAEISDSVVRGSLRYGVYSDSANEVSGTGNVMLDNGVDLARNLPGTLREPLITATERHIVFPDARYPTLQHAVDALVCGGTLVLREGEYPAGVTIGRPMELMAERGAQVSLAQGEPAGERPGMAPVLSLVGGARVGFSGITVTGGRNGFLLGNDAEATFTACRVAGNSGSGVALRDVSRVTMTDTTVAYNARGICLRGAAHATVMRCLVLGNGPGGGLALWDMSEVAVHASTIAGEGTPGVRQ